MKQQIKLVFREDQLFGIICFPILFQNKRIPFYFESSFPASLCLLSIKSDFALPGEIGLPGNYWTRVRLAMGAWGNERMGLWV